MIVIRYFPRGDLGSYSHKEHSVPSSTVEPPVLGSVVHSPMNIKHYAKEDDVFQLAANLAEKIMKDHAFQDGNKRTALLAADMFLKINGYYLFWYSA